MQQPARQSLTGGKRKMAHSPTPKWLRKHLKNGVVSYQEAQAMHLLILMGDPKAETVPMPPSLNLACERIGLMEMEDWSM